MEKMPWPTFVLYLSSISSNWDIRDNLLNFSSLTEHQWGPAASYIAPVVSIFSLTPELSEYDGRGGISVFRQILGRGATRQLGKIVDMDPAET